MPTRRRSFLTAGGKGSMDRTYDPDYLALASEMERRGLCVYPIYFLRLMGTEMVFCSIFVLKLEHKTDEHSYYHRILYSSWQKTRTTRLY